MSTPHDQPSQAKQNQPSAHVVLYHPEIPQNTGNIGRSCVAVGAKLWIVEPAGFDFSDKRVRRAGLDYWHHLDLQAVKSWDELLENLPTKRIFCLSRFATRPIWDAELKHGDCFVFGNESSGLPDGILDPALPTSLNLPTSDTVRSLNLAVTAGIVLFEQQRQIRLASTRTW